MSLDFEAIYRAYTGIVTSIDNDTGAFDKDGNKVEIDDSLVAQARVKTDYVFRSRSNLQSIRWNGSFY